MLRIIGTIVLIIVIVGAVAYVAFSLTKGSIGPSGNAPVEMMDVQANNLVYLQSAVLRKYKTDPATGYRIDPQTKRLFATVADCVNCSMKISAPPLNADKTTYICPLCKAPAFVLQPPKPAPAPEAAPAAEPGSEAAPAAEPGSEAAPAAQPEPETKPAPVGGPDEPF